jgi:hypothetical protein
VLLIVLMPEHRRDDGDCGGKKWSPMGEDLADIVAAAAKEGEEGVAEGVA